MAHAVGSCCPGSPRGQEEGRAQGGAAGPGCSSFNHSSLLFLLGHFGGNFISGTGLFCLKKKKKMPGNHCRSGKLSISEAVLRNSNLDFMPGREAPPSLSFPFCQVGVENPAMRIKEARNTLCLTWGRYTGKGCLPPPLLPPS